MTWVTGKCSPQVVAAPTYCPRQMRGPVHNMCVIRLTVALSEKNLTGVDNRKLTCKNNFAALA